jgi:hypothetical protein
MCAKHASFALPALLTSDAGHECTNVASQIEAQLSATNLAACTLVERPETFVRGFSPSDASTAVNSIEGMIGLAGEGLTHGQLPPAGLLTPDFVPTLRVVIDKIRESSLSAGIHTSVTAYAQATSLLVGNASCFDSNTISTLSTELAGMTGELNAASAYLSQLVTIGQAASSHEDFCLAASSRVRPTLPFPSLTQAERVFTSFWLGGMYSRMRGGGLLPLGSTQEARLYFLKDAFTQIGTLVGGADGAASADPFWWQVTIDGWGQWMNMNQGDGGTRYDNLIAMTERGQRQAQAGINALTTTRRRSTGRRMPSCIWLSLHTSVRLRRRRTTPGCPFGVRSRSKRRTTTRCGRSPMR